MPAALVHHVPASAQEAAAQFARPLHQLCSLLHQCLQPHQALPVLPEHRRAPGGVPPHLPVGVHDAHHDHHPLRPGDLDAQVARVQLEGDVADYHVGRADARHGVGQVLRASALRPDFFRLEQHLLYDDVEQHPPDLQLRVQERRDLVRDQLDKDFGEGDVGPLVRLPAHRGPGARQHDHVCGEPRLPCPRRRLREDGLLGVDPQRQLLPPRHDFGAAHRADAREPNRERGVDQPHQEGERGAQDAVCGGRQHGAHGQALRGKPLPRAPHPPQQRHRLQLAPARGGARAHPRGLCQELPHFGGGAPRYHRPGAGLLEARGQRHQGGQCLVGALPLQPPLRRAPRRHHRARLAPQGHLPLRQPAAPALAGRRQVPPEAVPHQPDGQRRQVFQGEGRRGHCGHRGLLHRRWQHDGAGGGDGQWHRHPGQQARPYLPALQPGLRGPQPQVRRHRARPRHHQEDHRSDGRRH
mmetsp:Transcript_4410/g.11414  ORF Transcript_4410/g.11414 Transcript_4410/m.11414 type:complete len:468 (+) Transcript_4410:324-1727(+)